MEMASLQFSFILMISLVAFILNGFLFLLVYSNCNLRTRFNLTILNACLADVFVSIQFLTLSIYSLITSNLPQGRTECTAIGFLHLLGFVASVTGIAAVSFYRFIIICRPHFNSKYFSKQGVFYFNASVWMFSLAISCPPLLGWGSFFFHSGMKICFVDWENDISYMLFMISVCFCGPITITLASVIFILRRRRTISFESDIKEIFMSENARICAAEKRKKKQKVERKITQSIIFVAVLFVICWGPFVVLMLIEAFSNYSIPAWIHAISIILGCLNSIANPVIYLSLNANFRKAASRKLRGWFYYSIRAEETNISSCTQQ